MKNLLKTFLLTLLLTSATTVYAASYTHYSEWMAYSQVNRGSSPNWRYDTSLTYEALFDTYWTYGGDKILTYAEKFISLVGSNGSLPYGYQADQLDYIRPGKLFLRYYNKYGGENYRKACETLLANIKKLNRTDAGPWEHKAIYTKQVWLDGIFMGLPFYTLASATLDKENLQDNFDDAVMQMHVTDSATYDASIGLWKHAWDETKSIFWADCPGKNMYNYTDKEPDWGNGNTGQSCHCWGRALGWYAMALLENMENFKAVDPADTRIATINEIFNRVMTAVVAKQDETGVWYDVLDVEKNDSRYTKQNYLEATCSSMFTYCLLKGWNEGYLTDLKFLEAGKKAYNGIITQFIKESNGYISLSNCCSVSGLGPANKQYRDGSFDYYMSESVIDNDTKGVGPFIWASLEAEKMGYTVQEGFANTSGITNVKDDNKEEKIYSLNGKRLPAAPEKGIYIKGGKKNVAR